MYLPYVPINQLKNSQSKFRNYAQQIKIESSGDTARMMIFDSILEERWHEDQPGVTASEVINQIEQLPASQPIEVLINSYGGDCAAAVAINSYLTARGGVTTNCIGYAWSAAGTIFLSGENRLMSTGGTLMYHNPIISGVFSSEEDFDSSKAAWTAARNSIVSMIKDRTDMDEEEIKNMLSAETYLTAEDAIKNGFATGTSKPSKDKDKDEEAMVNKRIDQIALTAYDPPEAVRSSLLSEANQTRARQLRRVRERRHAVVKSS